MRLAGAEIWPPLTIKFWSGATADHGDKQHQSERAERAWRLTLARRFLSGSLWTAALTPALCRNAEISSVGRLCLRNRSRNASSASSWKSIMRSRASKSSACQVSASNCTRLPGIALGRPFVVVVKKLRQLLAQAFVPLRLVPAHHRPLEQALLHHLRQLAPQIEGGEAQRLDEAFDALVFGHDPI